MLKLKNVSKFYYSKGMVASGFTKVNLEFNIGEFVAITGESGSGKSTLLNVISGLDTYEEGEMYINGEETSYYMEKDYELYRKKYVSNIFQSFNLVNSYTVYQNIELILLLNGYKRKEVKERVLDLIKEVGLSKYKNTKVSKLSGGQKQRVAIARSLAKDTPIILADEPTGNLDSTSAKSVLELLAKISKSKLVIVVTHNYDQIEEYATRKITMHDGKVLEDKKIKDYEEVKDVNTSTFTNLKLSNKLRLGFRNTFNIIPKFLLVLVVYLFVVLAFTSSYSSFKSSEYETSLMGYNYYFNDTSENRIVLNKNDKSIFTDEDFNKIKSLNNIERIEKNDLGLDTSISIYNDYYYFYGKVRNISDYTGTLTYGETITNDNEILIVGSSSSYYLSGDIEQLFNSTLELEMLYNYGTNEKYYVTVKGIELSDELEESVTFYLSENLINKIIEKSNKDYSTLTYTFSGSEYTSNAGTIYNEILPSDLVPKGEYVISEELTYNCNNANCKNYKLDINIKNTYYENTSSLSFYKYYTKKTFNKLTGYNYDEYNGAIFINTEDYNELYSKDIYQISVFVKDTKKIDETNAELNNLGYKTLVIKNSLVNYYESELAIIKIIKVVILGALLISLFFISYFIIKIILKSRNIYFTTLRLLGSTYKDVKQVLNIELLVIMNIAFIIFAGLLIVNNSGYLGIEINEMYKFLELKDILIIYLVSMIMSLLISNRFSRKLFKSSVMNTYKEEV